jgi:hypothetical protein
VLLSTIAEMLSGTALTEILLLVVTVLQLFRDVVV